MARQVIDPKPHREFMPTPEYSFQALEKTACRCPVCRGNGIVPNGFYSQTREHWVSASCDQEQCRSCGGRGYIIIDQ